MDSKYPQTAINALKQAKNNFDKILVMANSGQEAFIADKAIEGSSDIEKAVDDLRNKFDRDGNRKK